MATEVLLQIDGAVARVTFHAENGIPLFSRQTRERLNDVVEELEAATSVSVVVFQAEGRVFIAGADINELRDLSLETAYEDSRHGQAIMSRIAALPATTMAAIHGACAGGGCELALACDMRLAADGARIGLPETGIGIIPGWGGTVRATRLLGSGVARRMILTGELLPAAVALQLGLVDEVASAELFRDAVNRRVELILKRGPNARAVAKQLIAQFEGPDSESQFEAEARAFAACYETAEPVEGLSAFLEKRDAQWGG